MTGSRNTDAEQAEELIYGGWDLAGKIKEVDYEIKAKISIPTQKISANDAVDAVFCKNGFGVMINGDWYAYMSCQPILITENTP